MRFEKSCSFFVLRGFLPNCTLTRNGLQAQNIRLQTQYRIIEYPASSPIFSFAGKIYGFKTPISQVGLSGEGTTGGEAENWDMNA
jgi:hypothetical protein